MNYHTWTPLTVTTHGLIAEPVAARSTITLARPKSGTSSTSLCTLRPTAPGAPGTHNCGKKQNNTNQRN